MKPKNAALRHLLTVGNGNVVRGRYRPAQTFLQKTKRLDRTACLDIQAEVPASLAKGEQDFYLADNTVPLDLFAARGFLNTNTAAIVATPTDTHVDYAHQLSLAGYRTAVE